MLDLTLQFVNCCRASELRVSTAEVIDCMRHLKRIDPLDETQFKTVLRTNFAKSRRDQNKFDQLYQMFFHELKLRPDVAFEEADGPIQDIIARLQDEFKEADSLERKIVDFISGDPLAYIEKVKEIHTKEEDAPQVLKSNMGQLTNRLQVMLKINAVREKMLQFLGDHRDQVPESEAQAIEKQMTELFESANQFLTRDPRPNNDDVLVRSAGDKHLKQLGEQPFSTLTPDEVEEVRFVIKQMIRKLKDIVSLRYMAKNKGMPDIKKTLRQSARYLGIPLVLYYKSRPLRKTKIVALCDVSSSVWSAARFMLNILYSLQDCFNKVRSFIFVAQIAEVSEFFEFNEINEAIKKILTDAEIDYHVPTDYGEMLRRFKRNHMGIVDKKTTLIIIGDARSNYLNPEQGILRELREKSRRVIWLNPEPEQIWNTGDSEMYTYQAHCHEVRPCRNLNQLFNFIEELIL